MQTSIQEDLRLAPMTPRQKALPQRTLFGLSLITAEAGPVIENLLAPGPKLRVAFANAHCINLMQRDPHYRASLLTADRVLPDGIGVELAGRMNGTAILANLNGTDFVPDLLRKAAEKRQSVFLFGGRPGIGAAAASRLVRDIPGLRIAGVLDGYAGAQDNEAAIAAINASNADIVLVAMGVPLQDVWLSRNADRLQAHLTLGVGALFDFLADRVARAPQVLRDLRMEWIWRLAMEPRRMARRYLIGNFVFMLRETINAVRSSARLRAALSSKRLMDITVSGLSLLLLAPLLLFVALAIRVESRGPVLFCQTRIGLNGVPFTIFKFRSMFLDAEARRASLLAQSDREGICFKARNDPRITRVGRVLRRFSVDELPQILNILRGDMSIVGPRPALPQEVSAYPDRALGRLAVKPGLTGIWQVSGRAEIEFERMIEMDLAYARSRSAFLDILLITMTFRAIISGRGAY